MVSINSIKADIILLEAELQDYIEECGGHAALVSPQGDCTGCGQYTHGDVCGYCHPQYFGLDIRLGQLRKQLKEASASK